jgi:sulfoxide reductase heme-binding subunit YedZ
VTAATVSTLPWMWLVSRASGLMLLVTFSAVMILGVAVKQGSVPRRVQRFTTAEVHRTLSLFAVALLALHIVTAVLDPFVSIGWWATVIPFASHYRPLALALGTLAIDLGGAVLLTSIFRRRLGHRIWRATHWLAYLSWPVAVLHTLSAGNADMKIWWVAAIVWGSISAVGAAVVLRLTSRGDHTQCGRPAPSLPRSGPARVRVTSSRDS